MQSDDTPDASVPAPLSHDLELRPRNRKLTTVRQLLTPLVERFAEDLVEASSSLRRLAREAHDANDRVAEAALRAKIADQATALLRVCRDDSPSGPREIRSQRDLPDLSKLTTETRRRMEEALDAVENELGPEWFQSRG